MPWYADKPLPAGWSHIYRGRNIHLFPAMTYDEFKMLYNGRSACGKMCIRLGVTTGSWDTRCPKCERIRQKAENDGISNQEG